MQYLSCAVPGAVSVMLLCVYTPWEIHNCLISASLSLPVFRISPKAKSFVPPCAYCTFPTSLSCVTRLNFRPAEVSTLLHNNKAQCVYWKYDFFFYMHTFLILSQSCSPSLRIWPERLLLVWRRRCSLRQWSISQGGAFWDDSHRKCCRRCGNVPTPSSQWALKLFQQHILQTRLWYEWPVVFQHTLQLLLSSNK